jgi:hypothetical protein
MGWNTNSQGSSQLTHLLFNDHETEDEQKARVQIISSLILCGLDGTLMRNIQYAGLGWLTPARHSLGNEV